MKDANSKIVPFATAGYGTVTDFDSPDSASTLASDAEVTYQHLVIGDVAQADQTTGVRTIMPTDPFTDPPLDAQEMAPLPRDHRRDVHLMKHMVCAVNSSLQALFSVDALLGQYKEPDMSRSDMRRRLATASLSLKTTLLPLLGMLKLHYHFATMPPLTPDIEADVRKRRAYTSLHAAAGELLAIDDVIRECDVASVFDDLCDDDSMFGGKGWTQSEPLEDLTGIFQRVRSLGRGEAEGYDVGWWELFVSRDASRR
ncbi:hypothetical protein LTR36_003726 [Oleoguttula mirabilis]|uniref:Uncharacterized protein n=1 Tax=Oleoguttula mirabilis TaxID=1507867 RepID=A0AAV9JIX5_9PEZI|nr:hypothetical protein LTR36_003726 [Oleoguttula mirabilis]